MHKYRVPGTLRNSERVRARTWGRSAARAHTALPSERTEGPGLAVARCRILYTGAAAAAASEGRMRRQAAELVSAICGFPAPPGRARLHGSGLSIGRVRRDQAVSRAIGFRPGIGESCCFAEELLKEAAEASRTQLWGPRGYASLELDVHGPPGRPASSRGTRW
ncbi:hypothetical protein NDU88_004098 [Pleurodeles waltl]|uniref:Uncharacterized protein n=1 Tax=Pleurodeles waltl TaxID=8319 RepID=A0AAV7WUX2_PLEWA|nr:hypothetical protein NDU88_004098 [Pleurodeles waltl]